MDDLNPEVLAELKARAKRQIRTRMRGLRSAYPQSVLTAWNAQILERIATDSRFERAASIGLFWPMVERREIDLRELDVRARSLGKRVYYPFMEPRADSIFTGFRLVEDVTTLADRGRRFMEPAPDAPVAARGDIELVVVPALAVSAAGQRVGYGAGFYDATLPDFCPPAKALVVAYEFQLLAELPATEADVSCDVVITERRVLEVQ